MLKTFPCKLVKRKNVLIKNIKKRKIGGDTPIMKEALECMLISLVPLKANILIRCAKRSAEENDYI